MAMCQPVYKAIQSINTMSFAFLNPFASWSTSQEVKDFPEARKILYDLLHTWSKSLADPNDDCVEDVALLLGGLGASFDEIKQAGTTEGAKAGVCFAHKCDVISNLLQDVSARLEQDPNERYLMADVVDMLSKHVGRLTLNAYENLDVFALRMDAMVSLVEKRFQERTTEADPELENRNAELYEVWQHLYEVSPSCYCLQCGKRSVLNEL